MSVQFVIGIQGSAVTELLYDRMLSLSEEQGGDKLIYFVPEQATLQAQKELTERHPRHCVADIDILPFRRLAYRLTEELGDRLLPMLDDIGKGMVVKRVLQKKDSELTLYRNKAGKPGFVQEVKSLLSEFSRYMVEPETLQELSDRVDDSYMQKKLVDLSAILEGFRENLSSEYITEEDIYSAMCPLLEESERMKDTHLFLDGFTGFTPSQYELLRTLLRKAKTVTIAVTMDPACYHASLTPQHLFTMSARMIEMFEKMAKETGHELLAPCFAALPDKEPSLAHLQKHLFRQQVETYDKMPAITIQSLDNMRSEVSYVVGQIVELVQMHNYRYSDIGILCGDVEGYSDVLREALESAGIPFFIDYKSNAMSNALIDYIRSLLRIFLTDFRSDTVLHFMKNPLSDYSVREISYLENYLLARGIRGYSSWKRGFQGGYKTSHACNEEMVADVAARLLSELSPVRDALLSKATLKDKIVALYEFLRGQHLYDKLESLADRALVSDIPWARRREKEYRQIYRCVMELLDQLVALLGDSELSLQDLAGVLDTGFAELKVGVIPPEKDSVVVGDLKRSRLSGIRHLFFMAVNEGVVPGRAGASELLTQLEREKLKNQYALELSETRKESVSTEEFYLFLAFSRPTEHLTITYRRSGEDNTEYRPSYVVYRILRLFPELHVTTEADIEDFFDTLRADGGVSQFVHSYARILEEGGTPDELALYRWFLENEASVSLPTSVRELQQAYAGEKWQETMRAEVAELLYSHCLKGSVSRLEAYAACAYKHFLQYGLGLEERREFEPNAMDIGNAFHDALKRFFLMIKDSGCELRTMQDDVVKEYMQRAVEETMELPWTEAFGASNRNAYLRTTMERILHHMAGIFKEQQIAGSFDPAQFEQYQHYYSEHLDLRGIVDRIDMCKTEDGNFFKIVDYKSGKKEFDTNQMMAGLDIQLPAYMLMYAKSNPDGAQPAGAFYHKLDYPILDEAKSKEADRLRALRPSGLIRSESDVVKLMDRHCDKDGSYKSVYVPIEMKDGRYSGKDNNAYSQLGMDRLLNQVEQIMEIQAEEILSGNIKRAPYKSGSKEACTYCPYRGVCGKEHRTGPEYRDVKMMAMQMEAKSAARLSEEGEE